MVEVPNEGLQFTPPTKSLTRPHIQEGNNPLFSLVGVGLVELNTQDV